MYAEGQLDEYLAGLFPHNHKGVIIDVGACDPVGFSNSLYFEEKGWTAICIEPNPIQAAKLRKHPRKHVYEYAISNFDQDDADFTIFHHPKYGTGSCTGLGDGCRESVMFQQYSKQMTSSQKIKVKVRTLDTLLAGELDFLDCIDILTVDVEGTELDVIKGFDILNWSPCVVVLEDFEPNNKKAEFMSKLGYIRNNVINFNHVFVKQV